MTKEYDNTNRGVLFPNNRKEQETHADFQGTINIEGNEYWLNAWTKSGAKGEFYSLSVKPKEAAQNNARKGDYAASTKAQSPSSFAEDLDDTIPF